MQYSNSKYSHLQNRIGRQNWGLLQHQYLDEQNEADITLRNATSSNSAKKDLTRIDMEPHLTSAS